MHMALVYKEDVMTFDSVEEKIAYINYILKVLEEKTGKGTIVGSLALLLLAFLLGKISLKRLLALLFGEQMDGDTIVYPRGGYKPINVDEIPELRINLIMEFLLKYKQQIIFSGGMGLFFSLVYTYRKQITNSASKIGKKVWPVLMEKAFYAGLCDNVFNRVLYLQDKLQTEMLRSEKQKELLKQFSGLLEKMKNKLVTTEIAEESCKIGLKHSKKTIEQLAKEKEAWLYLINKALNALES